MKIQSLLLLSALVTAPFSVLADNSTGDWSFNGTVSNFSIDSEVAALEGIEDSALQIGLYADYLQNNWVSSIGASFLMYDDNREFRQTVIGNGLYNDGDISTESSDANAVLFHVATGYRWTFGEDNDFDFITQGGFSFPVMSERSIGNCTNCYSEDIDLDGGAFVKARLGRNGESVHVGFMLQQFISGDFGTVIGFEIGSAF